MQIACEGAHIPKRGKKSPFKTSELVEQRLGEAPVSSEDPVPVCQGVFGLVGLCVEGRGPARQEVRPGTMQRG